MRIADSLIFYYLYDIFRLAYLYTDILSHLPADTANTMFINVLTINDWMNYQTIHDVGLALSSTKLVKRADTRNRANQNTRKHIHTYAYTMMLEKLRA